MLQDLQNTVPKNTTVNVCFDIKIHILNTNSETRKCCYNVRLIQYSQCQFLYKGAVLNKYIRQGCTFPQVTLGPTAQAGSMDKATCGEPGNIEVPENESFQLFFSLKNAYDFIMVQ